VKRALALAAAVALAGLAACSSGSGKAKPSELNDQPKVGPYQGAGLIPPLPRPSFTLTDTSGKPYSFSSTAKHPTLLYFGYTHCPDVCPTTMVDIAQAIAEVPAALRAKTQVVFVTTDVKHDTAPVIAAWLQHFDTQLPNRFVGLTGSQGQIDAAQAAAHVELAEDGGQLHAADVLLYGADDYAHVKYLQSDNEADQIAHDLPLVDASSQEGTQ
jgi:protein SCO1/2